jgi:aryl-alcohol dehydrogenase-like predicted oxidoreductase
MLVVMLYRPLGNTGLQLSAIGLGGHWRTAGGPRYCDRFPDDEVPAETLRNRVEVVDFCLDAGINYLDITTAAECVAYGKAMAGRRQRIIIGADDYQWSARNPDCLNVPAMIANVERCLNRLRTDYLDIWRVVSEIHGHNTDRDLETVIEAADRLRQAGKIRHLGLSSHHPGWIARALEQFAAFEVALIPSVPAGCGDTAIPGVDAGANPFEIAARRRVGVIGIKPFAGGLLFRPAVADSDVTHGVANDELNNALAREALRSVLHERANVTCVIPGMSSLPEAMNAIAAVTAPPPDPDRQRWLTARIAAQLASLPPDYRWLSAWNAWAQPSRES